MEEGLQQLHMHQGGLGQVHHQQVQLNLSTWWPSVCHLAPYVSSAIGLPLFEPSLTYSLHSPSTRCESTSTSRSCSCTSPCSTSPRSQCYVSCQANCRDLRRRGGINICFALSNTQSLVLQVTSAHPDWLAQCLPCSRSLREAPRWRVNFLGGSQVEC